MSNLTYTLMPRFDTLIGQINASIKFDQGGQKNAVCLVGRVFLRPIVRAEPEIIQTIYFVLAEEVPFPGPFFVRGPLRFYWPYC
jgi:hypothetical protein